jgi:type IV pilus assembly protein PilW
MRAPLAHPASVRDALRSSLGTSLVDVLVGLVVAMVAVVVVYRAFAALDALRRSGVDASDAQIAATFALDTVATQVANAGAGWSAASAWLDTCPASADFATSLRPLAVLVTDGGSPTRSDSIAIREALGPGVAIGAAFAAPASAGGDFIVEATDGFAIGNRIVAVSRTGNCAGAQVTARTSISPGVLRIGHTAVTDAFPITSVLLDLGPAGVASALRFDVSSGTIRSTDIANGDAPVPLAANVVNLKFQYGVDSDGDGALDTWVAAGTSGPWSPSAMLTAPRSALQRIKAVRIGLVVRSDERDRALQESYRWVLFDCDDDDKTRCPGRLEGVIPATSAGNYRFRTMETIIPLRNIIWNTGV